MRIVAASWRVRALVTLVVATQAALLTRRAISSACESAIFKEPRRESAFSSHPRVCHGLDAESNAVRRQPVRSGARTVWRSRAADRLKVADLRRTLLMIFTAHGKVLDIVTKRREGMRGSAFVVFEDVQAATSARKREDGHVVLGKAMARYVVLSR